MAKLTQAELERHHWQAADILRDTLHAAPTPGLKALGAAWDHWHRLFRTHRGEVLKIVKIATMMPPERLRDDQRSAAQ